MEVILKYQGITENFLCNNHEQDIVLKGEKGFLKGFLKLGTQTWDFRLEHFNLSKTPPYVVFNECAIVYRTAAFQGGCFFSMKIVLIKLINC